MGWSDHMSLIYPVESQQHVLQETDHHALLISACNQSVFLSVNKTSVGILEDITFSIHVTGQFVAGDLIQVIVHQTEVTSWFGDIMYQGGLDSSGNCTLHGNLKYNAASQTVQAKYSGGAPLFCVAFSNKIHITTATLPELSVDVASTIAALESPKHGYSGILKTVMLGSIAGIPQSAPVYLDTGTLYPQNPFFYSLGFGSIQASVGQLVLAYIFNDPSDGSPQLTYTLPGGSLLTPQGSYSAASDYFAAYGISNTATVT